MSERVSSPADASSASDSASCTTTSVLRVVALTQPPPMRLRSMSLRSVRDAFHAGTMPNSKPVAIDTASAKSSTRTSSRIVAGSTGSCGPTSATSDFVERHRERDAGDAAEQRQQHTLGEQLLRDASAAGAERGAHRKLARARRAARELEIGDVRAGDEQHERDRAEHDEQTLANAADELVLERRTSAPVPAFVAGYSLSSCFATADRSRCAAAIVTPGFSRPDDAARRAFRDRDRRVRVVRRSAA